MINNGLGYNMPGIHDLPKALLVLNGAVSALGLLYVLGIVIYRLYFHPLAKYPGPFLGKITDFYSVIRAAAGDRHIHFLELHKKYGTFVRFGPNRISVNTPEGLQKIYGAKANTRKSSYYHVFNDVFDGGDSSLTTTDAQLHLRKKRVVSGALSESSLRAMEDLVLRNVRMFVDKVGEEKDGKADNDDKEWSAPQNMTDWADYLSFDIMGDICFSESFGMLTRPDHRFVLRVLAEGVNGLNMSGWMPIIVRLKVGQLLFARLNADLRRYEAFANERSRRRLALGEQGAGFPDVYSHLIRANNNNNNNNNSKNEKGGTKETETEKPLFTTADLVGESSLLITGGSDTTATALSAALFYLLHNASTLARVTAEVRSCTAFEGDEENIRAATIGACRYLRACIDEAMRMSPGVPGILPRTALGPQGVEIAGHVFAPGTDLGVPHYAVHHNEDVYPDSFTYRPERWLVGDGDSDEDAVALAQSGFCPFSVGPRGCVGKALAMKELMVTVARLLWRYDMRLAPGQENCGAGGKNKGYGRHRPEEYQLKDMFVAKTDGPMVQFRKRVA